MLFDRNLSQLLLEPSFSNNNEKKQPFKISIKLLINFKKIQINESNLATYYSIV